MGDYSIIGQYTNGNQTMHEYDALGNRVRTTYYTRKSLTAVPIGNILHPENNTSDYTITVDGFNENIVYTKVNPTTYNGTTWMPKFVHNPEGLTRQYSTSESNYLGSNRAVCIHYAGNHDGNYELKSQDRIAVRWSTKCMVVSNDYTLDKSGYVLYNSIKSFNAALGVAKYCGASGYTVRTTNNGNGNYYICNGIKNYGIIRIIK